MSRGSGFRVVVTLVIVSACATAAVVERATRPGDRGAYGLVFSPKGDRVACLTASGSPPRGALYVWDVATGQRLFRRDGAEPYQGLAYAPDGRTLAVAEGKTVRFLGPATGREVAAPLPVRPFPLKHLAYSADGSVLVVAQLDGTIEAWDMATRRPRWRKLCDQGITSMSFSADGRTLATANGVKVRLLDLATGRDVTPALLSREHGPVAFAPDRPVLASVSNVPSRPYPFPPVLNDLRSKPNADGVYPDPLILDVMHADSLAFSPDGQAVAAGSNGTVTLWDSRGAGQIAGPTATLRNRPPNPLQDLGQAAGVVAPPTLVAVWSVAFHPDGRTVASATSKGVIDLWDWRADRHRLLLIPPDRPFWAFAVVGLCVAVMAGGGVMLGSSFKERRGTSETASPHSSCEQIMNS